jgi:hypothetical protein
MMMASDDCIYSESDIPSRYVAGVVATSEAERFEEHYFSCDRCWNEVNAGNAARAVLAPSGERIGDRIAGAREEDQRSPWWMAAAAAAIIAVIGVATIRERSESSGPDVIRGASAPSIPLNVSREGAKLHARWRAVPAADRYRVEARDADGDLLEERSSAGTSAAFDGLSDHDVFVRVTALDAQGEEIARSALVHAPSRAP